MLFKSVSISRSPQGPSKFLGGDHLPVAGGDGSYNFSQTEHTVSPDF